MPLFTVTGGMGDAVERWAGLTDAEIERAALDAADEVAWDLVAEIESQAHLGPNERWHHVAGFFEPLGGGAVGIRPEYPESREAFDLEYGTEGRSPLPVMRSSVTATWKAHGQQWAAAFHRTVFGA